MSELILHAAHLSEAHQLRFSYLFEVAAKHWRDKQPAQAAKPATELWVIDAQSAPEAIRNRSNSSFVLLIATEDQAQALRAQWPDQIDAQLPPDYSVGRLTQLLEHISVQAHGKRLRETLKNRRQHGMTLAHDVQLKNADAAFLKATDLSQPVLAVAEPAIEPPAVPPPCCRSSDSHRQRTCRWHPLSYQTLDPADGQHGGPDPPPIAGRDDLRRSQPRRVGRTHPAAAQRNPARAASVARQRRADGNRATGGRCR